MSKNIQIDLSIGSKQKNLSKVPIDILNGSIEQSLLRLCTKIALMNNLNEKNRNDFINANYAYLLKLLCSDAYTPAFDMFEVAQKIKRKRIK
jgi:hypothetical protein